MANEQIPDIIIPIRYEYKDAGLRQAAKDLQNFSATTGSIDIVKGFNRIATTFRNTRETFSLESPKIVSQVNSVGQSFAKTQSLIENWKLAIVKLTIAENKGTYSAAQLAKMRDAVSVSWGKVTASINKSVVGYQNLLTEEDRFRGNKQEIAINKRKVAWDKFANSIKKISSSFHAAISHFAAAIYVIRRVVNFIKNLVKEIFSFIDASSKWIENLNLLEVVFADVSEGAQTTKDWVARLSKQLSMDKNALVQYISTFKQMANAMGQAADVGERMSEVLTQLGLDISSLRNVKTETAMSDLASAIAGQIKPVRKYGFDVSLQSINAMLKEAGIGGSATELSQSDKQLARTILLIRQSKDAWGDLAKTINTFANQQRILNDQWETTKRLLGQVFLGTFQFGQELEEAEKTAGIALKIIWKINAAMIAFNTILEAILPKADSVNGAMATLGEDVGDDIDDATEALERSLATFDKFNVLSQGSDSSEARSAKLEELFNQESQKYIEEFEKRIESIKSYSSEIADTWLKEFFPAFAEWRESNPEGTFSQWFEDSKMTVEELLPLISSLKEWASAFKAVFSSLFQILTALSPFMSLINEYTASLLLNLANAIVAIVPIVEKLSEILVNIFEIAQPILVALIDLFASAVIPIVNDLVEMLAPLIRDILELVAPIIMRLIPKVTKALKDAWDFLRPILQIIVNIVDLFANILSFFDRVNDFINNDLSPLAELLDIISNVLKTIFLVVESIITVVMTLVKLLQGLMNWNWDAVGKDISNMWSKLTLNWQTNINNYKAIPSVFKNKYSSNASDWGKNWLNRYANGGYQTGGLFYAGESGAEWVGRQGNTSTIVNDKQMSDIMQKSVAMGVIQGNRASSGNAGTNKVAVVNLDGKRLFEVVQENGKRVGKVFAEA